MLYTNITPETFEKIPVGEKITARTISLEIRRDTKIYIFKSNTGSYSCLFQVENTKTKLPEINGINISYETFSESNSDMMLFIRFECTYLIYLREYTEILKEIIQDFDKGGTQSIILSVKKIISKWKYFLSEPQGDILNEDNIIGLIGELLLLKKIIVFDKENSISFWEASRGEEDFIIEQSIIEVKTTIKESHQHTINGIDQLKTTQGRSKYILSILISLTNEENSLTLPRLISDITDFLFDNPALNDLFLQKLKARGYDIRDSEIYLKYKYSLRRGALFTVDDSFPKLTTAQLSTPLSPRISKISYLIDLEGIDCIDFIDLNIKRFISRSMQ
jgi:hypothetical protein